MGEVRSRLLLLRSVLSSGFSRSEYRPPRPESCFCASAVCRMRIFLPGLPLSAGSDRGIFPSIYLITSLPLTLGSVSKSTGHPGLIAASAPLGCPVGWHPTLHCCGLLGSWPALGTVCGSHLCPSSSLS